MKKQLFLFLGIFLSITACEKDASISSTKAPKLNVSAKSPIDVGQPTYTDMNLQPRKPGENFDTYFAQWNGCGIEVKGPITWDLVKYPNLVNGVPIVMANISTYDGTSTINSFNTGNDGDIFEVTQIHFGGLPSTGFKTDYDTYIQALVTYYANGGVGAAPQLSSILQTTYSAGGLVTTYTGKFIRVTTGSNLAIAPVTYPLPTAAPESVGNLDFVLYDDPSHPTIAYMLHGVNGNFTYADQGTMVNGVANFVNSVRVSITGTYTKTPGTSIYHYGGTIIRAVTNDYYSFNLTQDLS